MNEVVKYHNNFNKIQLPSFTEQEQNILFTILAKVKNNNGEAVRLFLQDLTQGRVESKEAFTAIIDSVKNKFFKANFRYIRETKTEIIDTNINLFKKMEVHYTKRDPNDGDDNSKLFNYIDLQVNEEFEYILNNITANFTRFELAEFTALSGKYTKTLYRLLKQYRSTGYFYMEWNEFKRVMDIPSTYAMSDIEKQILKPAIKELTQERNLFDQKRIPFRNLVYKKLKSGGNKISAIVINFKAQEQELEPQLESPNKNIELSEYRYKKVRVKGENGEFILQVVTQIADGKINILTNDFSKNYANLDDFKNNVEIVGEFNKPISDEQKKAIMNGFMI